MKHIIVIGGGSSCALLLDQLLAAMESEPILRASVSFITIFSGPNTKDTLGDISAFGNLPDFHILNTNNSVMDRLVPKWKAFRETQEAQNEDYSQRRIFGKFAKELFEKTVSKLKKLADVEVVYETANHVNKVNNPFFQLDTQLIVRSNSKVVVGDYLFLAIGNTKTYKKCNVPGIVPAYSSEIKTIPPNSSVGIIGTGLRAVDVLLGLASQKHQGRIIAVSRLGRFPRIQPTKMQMARFSESLPPFDISMLHGKPATLQNLFRLMKNDFLEKGISLKSIFNLFKSERTTSTSWNLELEDVENGNRDWHCRAFQLTAMMEDSWFSLCDADQVFFDRYLRSQWIANIIGIPKCSAIVIKSLFDSKQLETMSGYNKACRIGGGPIPSYCITDKHGNESKVDFLIDASRYGLTGGDNQPLVDNLRRINLASCSTLGRVKVNWNSMELVEIQKELKGKIFGIGEFVMGPNFCTSSVETNLRMAKTAVNCLSNSILANYLKKDLSTHGELYEVNQLS